MEQIQPFDFDTWCNTNRVPVAAATTLENAGYNLYDSLATLNPNSDVWITVLKAVLPGHQAIIKKAIANLASQFANTVVYYMPHEPLNRFTRQDITQETRGINNESPMFRTTLNKLGEKLRQT